MECNNRKRPCCVKCNCGCVPCCCLRGERGPQGPQGPQGEPGEPGESTLLNLVDGNAAGSVRGINTADNYEMGINAVAIGEDTVASGDNSFASGLETTASGFASFTEGFQTVAEGIISHAEGAGTIANGDAAHAEGVTTEASGEFSHAEGWNSISAGGASHAECLASHANGDISHAEGYATRANGRASHSEGYRTIADGDNSHAEGRDTVAEGDFSHAANYNTVARNNYQTVIGRQNLPSNPANNNSVLDDAFIIGNGGLGIFPYFSNAFRVQFNGDVHASAYLSGGADYAEMFEWADKNCHKEDRAGCFVALKGDKIRVASCCDCDNIIGVVSSNPSIIGDAQSLGWHGMYLRDNFGRIRYEWVNEKIEVLDLDFCEQEENNCNCPDCIKEKLRLGETPKFKTETIRVRQPLLNPDYDKDREYLPRTEREEWAAVGLMGKLIVRDDGTCTPDGYCLPNECGFATKSNNGYRVLKRIDKDKVVIFMFPKL